MMLVKLVNMVLFSSELGVPSIAVDDDHRLRRIMYTYLFHSEILWPFDLPPPCFAACYC
jgi:hypothetical protein